jgi:hypothetical protein
MIQKLGVVAACLAMLGATGNETVKHKLRGPRIVVEPVVFDFGELQQHKTVHKEFTVSNEGSEDLRIERVITDCGCTVAGLDEKVLAPGASTTLRVKLDTRSRLGSLRKRVLVHSNDRSRRSFEVRLKAVVVEKK